MSNQDSRPTLEVPARKIPIPTSISPATQAYMARPSWGAQRYPALDDTPG